MFYWLRLTDSAAQNLLKNNGESFIDADLRRRYDLDIVTRAGNVYEVISRDSNGKVVEKKLMAKILSLNTFYNNKGQALFDNEFLKDPNMYYNICLDEMNREAGERNTFDILNAFANQIENIVRLSPPEKVRVICIGNLIAGCDLLAAFNFIPIKPGRYRLRKHRAVIEYMEQTKPQKEKRKNAASSFITPDASTFTNEVEYDVELVRKRERLIRPVQVIMFAKDRKKWFTLWQGQQGSLIIRRWTGEILNDTVAMVANCDKYYDPSYRDTIVGIYNRRGYCYRDLST